MTQDLIFCNFIKQSPQEIRVAWQTLRMDKTINIEEDQVCEQGNQGKEREISYIEIQESSWPNQEETNPEGDSVVRNEARLEEGQLPEEDKGESNRNEPIIIESEFAEPPVQQKEVVEASPELTNEFVEKLSKMPEKQLREEMSKAMPETVDKFDDLSFSELHQVLKHIYIELNPNNNIASLTFYAEQPVNQEVPSAHENTEHVSQQQLPQPTVEQPIIEVNLTQIQNEQSLSVPELIKEREDMTKEILEFLPEFQRDLNNMNLEQVRQLYKEVQAEYQKSLQYREMSMNSGLKDQEEVAVLLPEVSEQEEVAVEAIAIEAVASEAVVIEVQVEVPDEVMVEEVSAPTELINTISVCQSEEISKSKVSQKEQSIQLPESNEQPIIPTESQPIDNTKQQESQPDKKTEANPSSVDPPKNPRKGGIAQLREELIKKSPEIAETILCLNDRELEEMYYQCKKVNPKKPKKVEVAKKDKKAEEVRQSKNKTEIFEIPQTKSGKRRSQTIVLMHTEYDDEPVYETRQKIKRTQDGVVKKTTTNQKEVSDVLKRILKVLAEE